MAAKLTSLTQQMAVLCHIVAESCNGIEICTLWGYFPALNGNHLPTFRDNGSVPSSGVKKSKKNVLCGLLDP
jgi:hypothetical protein